MASSPARVAVFIPQLGGGGAERIMLELAAGFASRRRAVDLVVCRAVGAFSERVPSNVRLVELGPSRTLMSLPRLMGYLRRVRPEAMLSALNHANITAIWARRLAHASTRIVVSEHTTPTEAARYGGWKQRMIVTLIRGYYGWADEIVASSNGVAQDVQAITGLPQERIRVIHNPIVPGDAASMRAAPRHPWFDDGGPPVVLAVGRLSAPKNFASLLRAFAMTRTRRPSRLIILGEGDERTHLETVVHELGIEEHVALPGFEPHPYASMARAAVVVLSSLWEGFGNVLAEALACGTTVVSTNCRSGPAEILENGKYGFLVPPADDEALAAAIVRALDQPFDAAMLRDRGRDFGLDRTVDRYLDALLG